MAGDLVKGEGFLVALILGLWGGGCAWVVGGWGDGVGLVEGDDGGVGDYVSQDFIRVEGNGAIGSKGVAGDVAVCVGVLPVEGEILVEAFAVIELVQGGFLAGGGVVVSMEVVDRVEADDGEIHVFHQTGWDGVGVDQGGKFVDGLADFGQLNVPARPERRGGFYGCSQPRHAGPFILPVKVPREEMFSKPQTDAHPLADG